MSGMHLKQPRFTYSADGPFANSKKKKKKFKSLKRWEIQNVFTKMN